MTIITSRYIINFSLIILIFGILYMSEVPTNPPDRKTLLLTKKAMLEYNRSYVFKIITNIDKYTAWYPNVARVEHVRSQTDKNGDAQYRLITIIPIIGDVSSSLIIHTKDQPKRFIYSVNSWLLETNSIELKDNLKNANSTFIEWTVYTKRRSILFQYLFLPFAKFYKHQIVREALFSLKTQIRNL